MTLRSAAERSAVHVAIVAVIVGIAGANWVHMRWWPPIVAAAVLAATAALLAAKRAAPVAACVGLAALVLLGSGWGIARLGASATHPVRHTGASDVVALVETVPVPTNDGYRARVRLQRTIVPRGALPAGTRLLAELPRVGSPVHLGSVVRLAGTVRPAVRAGDPGWWRRYLDRQMIAGVMHVRRAAVIGRRAGLNGLRDSVRGALGDAAGRGLEGDVRTLVRGMALGGGGGLSDAVADDMRRAGLWHLLAVSGQNIAYVVLAVGWLVDVLGLGRRPGKVVALLCVALYCLACEGGASVWRAGVVGSLVIVGELLERERARGYLTLVGLAGLLALQPRAIADPGLQLSFAAVFGLLILAPTLRIWLGGFFAPRGAEYVAASVAATLATAPITIANFGTVSVIGVIVNVLIAPLAGPIVIAALVGAVIGTANAAIGEIPTMVAGWGASIMADIARAAARVPGAASQMGGVGFVVATSGIAAIPVMRWWLWTAEPGGVSRPSGPLRRQMVVVVVVAVCAIAVWPRASVGWPGTSTVTVLDVGQGDAILLRSPDGAAVLVDTGPSGEPAPVARQLRQAGVRTLSALIVTHDQTDHAGAASAVLASTSTAAVFAPGPGGVSRALQARLGRSVRGLTAGEQVRAGDWSLDVLWPPASLPRGSPNDGALVIRATCPQFSVLLGSDVEGGVLRRLSIGQVDVLKVSHHGSDDPQLATVLSALRPTIGVVSVGAHNGFGHPTLQTIATLRRFGLDLRRTDRDGAVTIAPFEGGLRTTSAR